MVGNCNSQTTVYQGCVLCPLVGSMAELHICQYLWGIGFKFGTCQVYLGLCMCMSTHPYVCMLIMDGSVICSLYETQFILEIFLVEGHNLYWGVWGGYTGAL